MKLISGINRAFRTVKYQDGRLIRDFLVPLQRTLGSGDVLRSNLWSSQFVTVSQFVTESVAICDWKCRNLWREVSRFVTGSVAICDKIKICNLMAHIQSISMNMLFFHIIYTNMRLISRICPYILSAALSYLSTSHLGNQTVINGTKLKVSQWCQTFITIIS